MPKKISRTKIALPKNRVVKLVKTGNKIPRYMKPAIDAERGARP